MQGLVFADEIYDALDKGVATQIGKFAQCESAAQMSFAVGVASGTRKRAFASDFDGEQRNISGKDSPPGGENLSRRKTGIGGRGHMVVMRISQGEILNFRGKESNLKM